MGPMIFCAWEIKWGGHQNAPDDGFDVVVDSEVEPPKNSFIPRASTSYQVKATKMGPVGCANEMCPKGKFRESIKELIKKRWCIYHCKLQG